MKPEPSASEDASSWVVETHSLTRRFGKILAVDRLDLAVRRGEIFGLVGPDGSGKTTTLRLIAAIMDPTSGTARVAGLDTRHQAEAIKKRLGYMAQQFSLYGDLSVSENLSFFADIFQVTGRSRRERIERLLDFARLRQFRDRRAINLSGGMQKKLALACTLIHSPEILLLDEPTTGVDPVSRREFWDILTELHIQGTTILVCTPYMDEAERCSRVALMFEGQLLVCDTPARVKAMTKGDLLALQPQDLRSANELLSGMEGVLEVQTYGDRLHIFVDDAGLRTCQIEAALQGAGVAYSDLRRAQPRMEEAFISLIRREMDHEDEGPVSP